MRAARQESACTPDHEARGVQRGRHVGEFELHGLEGADVLPELAAHGGMLQRSRQAEGRATHAAGRNVDAPAAHCARPAGLGKPMPRVYPPHREHCFTVRRSLSLSRGMSPSKSALAPNRCTHDDSSPEFCRPLQQLWFPGDCNGMVHIQLGAGSRADAGWQREI